MLTAPEQPRIKIDTALDAESWRPGPLAGRYPAAAMVILFLVAACPALFIAGHVLLGLRTSPFLIAAVPRVFLGYPAAKLRWSAVIVNMFLSGSHGGPADRRRPGVVPRSLSGLGLLAPSRRRS